jgi:hypothetical protein
LKRVQRLISLNPFFIDFHLYFSAHFPEHLFLFNVF